MRMASWKFLGNPLHKAKKNFNKTTVVFCDWLESRWLMENLWSSWLPRTIKRRATIARQRSYGVVRWIGEDCDKLDSIEGCHQWTRGLWKFNSANLKLIEFRPSWQSFPRSNPVPLSLHHSSHHHRRHRRSTSTRWSRLSVLLSIHFQCVWRRTFIDELTVLRHRRFCPRTSKV